MFRKLLMSPGENTISWSKLGMCGIAAAMTLYVVTDPNFVLDENSIALITAIWSGNVTLAGLRNAMGKKGADAPQ